MRDDLQFHFYWRRQLDGCRAVASDPEGKTVATITLELGPAFGPPAATPGKDEIESLLRAALERLAGAAR